MKETGQLRKLIASNIRSTASHISMRMCVNGKKMSREMPSEFVKQILAGVLQHSGSTTPLDEPLNVSRLRH